MKELNHSKLLSAMAGQPGDYYIGTTPVTTKKFSHIVIGPDGATVNVCRIRGVDVKTARAYAALPAGYVMCAGGDDYFDSIHFTAGSGQGVLYDEESAMSAVSVAVADGYYGETMTPTITFTRTGVAGSRRLNWRVKDNNDTVLQSGDKTVYFLPGTGATVTIPGLSYYEPPVAPTTTAGPTTTAVPTTTAAPTTTSAETTTAGETTTAAPTTTAEPTTYFFEFYFEDDATRTLVTSPAFSLSEAPTTTGS